MDENSSLVGIFFLTVYIILVIHGLLTKFDSLFRMINQDKMWI
jgi:hypothetical protein